MSNHDRSACLLVNGQLVAAIAEERLDRRKRSPGFMTADPRGHVAIPMRSVTYVLKVAGLSIGDLDLLVCGRSISSCRDEVLEQLRVPEDLVVEPPLPGHHLAHAYSAYGPCPFGRAAVLVIDEQGSHKPDHEYEKCSWFEADEVIKPIKRFWGDRASLSLGMFFDSFAALTSLREGGLPSAGKLMALAAYAEAAPAWPELVDLAEDGDVTVSLAALDEFFRLAGLRPRDEWIDRPALELDDLVRKYRPLPWRAPLSAQLAAKAQTELERAVLHSARALREASSARDLCYAGGVALNVIANSRLGEAGWRDVFVQPAATDDGCAVGLAWYGWSEVLGRARVRTGAFKPYLGRTYAEREIETSLGAYGLIEFTRAVSPAAEAASRIASGQIVAWFQGASEWGPRALGARSIVANPLLPGVAHRVNVAGKFREEFRPYGLSATGPALDELCETAPASSLSPYMLCVARVRQGTRLSVAHADGTVRYQLVREQDNPLWYALLLEAESTIGVAAVLNTSFNALGEPLVETPDDAVRLFLVTHLDALVIGGRLLARNQIADAVLSAAVMRARASTIRDPLGAAAALYAHGYPKAALSLLSDAGFTNEDAVRQGPAVYLRYRGLEMRAAVALGDRSRAVRAAVDILGHAAISEEVAAAARFLAEEGDGTEAELGLRFAAISGTGLRDVLAGEPAGRLGKI